MTTTNDTNVVANNDAQTPVESKTPEAPAQGTILTGTVVSPVQEGKSFVLVQLTDEFTGLLHEKEMRGRVRDDRNARLRALEKGEQIEVAVREVGPSDKLKQGVHIQLSEKPIVARERREAQAAYAETLTVGDTVTGTVSDFLTEKGEDGKKVGAFVRFGEAGLRGLVHISQMPGADNDAQRAALEALTQGQELSVVITRITAKERGPEVALSLKRIAQQDFLTTLEAGSTVDGVVSGFLLKGDEGRKYRIGAFISLPHGLKGLVHATEFPGNDRREKNEALDAMSADEEVSVKVLKAESADRISLSLAHQDSADHAARLLSRDKVKGRVLGSRDDCYEIDLGQGITGKLPVSALGATLREGGNVWVKVESVDGATATCSRNGI